MWRLYNARWYQRQKEARAINSSLNDDDDANADARSELVDRSSLAGDEEPLLGDVSLLPSSSFFGSLPG